MALKPAPCTSSPSLRCSSSSMFAPLPLSLSASLSLPSCRSSGCRSLRVLACQAGDQASSNTSPDFAPARRDVILSGAASLCLSSLSLSSALQAALPSPASAAEVALSSWEQIPLPVDPGVVLLDIAVVPEEPERGFLLGTRQTLLETRDGGKSWFQREIPSAQDEDFNYRFNSISFNGKEGWIVGKPAILLHTADAGATWQRVPLSARLPGTPVIITATGKNQAEMVTDEGAVYVTSNQGYNWKAAVEETVSATLNRTVSSGISGASYYTGTFSSINRSPEGNYVAVSSRGNFFMTWEPGQTYWQPHNRTSARRIQNMGWRSDGGLWLLVRGGGLFLGRGQGVTEDFDEVRISSRGFGILDLAYRTPTEAWAAGGSGVLIRTEDAGKTWSRDKGADQLAANLYSVKFVGEGQGFILGNDGVLLRYLG